MAQDTKFHVFRFWNTLMLARRHSIRAQTDLIRHVSRTVTRKQSQISSPSPSLSTP